MKKILITIISLHILGWVSFGNLNTKDSAEVVVENDFFKAIRANQVESYITFGQGLGNIQPLIFEGLIAPYFLIRTSHNAKFGATLSPAILMRMEAKESFPVYAPSYMPNLTIYRQVKPGNRSKFSSSYIFLTLEHHSNGQNGDFYNDDGSYNVMSGDFSTNQVEMGIFINRKVLPFPNTTEYFRSSIEFYPNIGRSEELEGQFSFLRWYNSFRIFRVPGYELKTSGEGQEVLPKVQTKAETAWLFGKVNNAGFFDLGERLNLSATISYRPKALTDVSFFLNFYSGKDYYNMQFNRRINTLRIGIQAFAFK